METARLHVGELQATMIVCTLEGHWYETPSGRSHYAPKKENFFPIPILKPTWISVINQNLVIFILYLNNIIAFLAHTNKISYIVVNVITLTCFNPSCKWFTSCDMWHLREYTDSVSELSSPLSTQCTLASHQINK